MGTSSVSRRNFVHSFKVQTSVLIIGLCCESLGLLCVSSAELASRATREWPFYGLEAAAGEGWGRPAEGCLRKSQALSRWRRRPWPATEPRHWHQIFGQCLLPQPPATANEYSSARGNQPTRLTLFPTIGRRNKGRKCESGRKLLSLPSSFPSGKRPFSATFGAWAAEYVVVVGRTTSAVDEGWRPTPPRPPSSNLGRHQRLRGHVAPHRGEGRGGKTLAGDSSSGGGVAIFSFLSRT